MTNILGQRPLKADVLHDLVLASGRARNLHDAVLVKYG